MTTDTPHTDFDGDDSRRTTARLRRLAWWLDSSIRIPGTSWRIGLDGLLGLVPGIGDAAAAVASGYIVLSAVRLGVPWSLTARMVFNVILEGVVGVVPIAGDLFDFAFKANERNVRLLLDYLDTPRPVHRRSRFIVVGSVIVVGVLFALFVALIVALIVALLSALFG
ncbi:MAG: DUF4112 domain-containing protein [Gammaproteobacteria bacterium]